MDPIIGGLLTGGASLLGSIFNANQSAANTQATIAGNESMMMQQENYNTGATQQAQQFDQNMVQQQENYETQMSNSAYQRATADMKAAGLNPILAAGGASASTPSISAPTSSPMGVTAPRVDYSGNKSAYGDLGSAVSQAISTATSLKTADATVDNLVADNARIKANTINSEVDSALKASQDKKIADVDIPRGQEETKLTAANVQKAANDALTAKNDMAIDPSARKILDQTGFAGRKIDDVLSPVSNVISSAKQWNSMLPKKSTTETTSSNGGSTFTERWGY